MLTGCVRTVAMCCVRFNPDFIWSRICFILWIFSSSACLNIIQTCQKYDLHNLALNPNVVDGYELLWFQTLYGTLLFAYICIAILINLIFRKFETHLLNLGSIIQTFVAELTLHIHMNYTLIYVTSYSLWRKLLALCPKCPVSLEPSFNMLF